MKKNASHARGSSRGSTRSLRPSLGRRALVLSVLMLVSACTESAETGPTAIPEDHSLTIQSVALPGAEVGQPYAVALKASGGSGTYSWSMVSGNLPEGLLLEGSGLLHGTPTRADSGVFTVQATDEQGNTKNQKLSLKVKGGPPRIRTRSLPNGTVGTAYAQTLEADGGAGGYAWDVSAGTLPAGLSLSAAGVLAGTPSEAGTQVFTVRIADQAGVTDAREFTLQIDPAPGGPVIQTSSLPDGEVGTSYAGRLEAAGGSEPYAWGLAEGALPEGLTLSSDGAISGTPSTAGPSTFTARVTDAADRSATRTFTVDVTDGPTPPRIETSSLPDGQVGDSYSVALAATGGTPAYTWSLGSGSLPEGLALGASGEISGTPTTEGTATFTVRVEDQSGLTDTRELSLAVAAEPQPPAIQTTALPAGEVGSAYSATLEATGGAPAYSWDLAGGSLPSGLSLSGAGALTGTPSNNGTSSFTVRVTDQNGLSDTRALSIEIVAAPEPPSIQTTSLPAGEAGSAYSATLEATGGAPAYSWDLAGGSLPAGLSLSGAGALTGTPSSSGTSNFTVRVTDQNGLSDSQALSIEVTSPPNQLPTAAFSVNCAELTCTTSDSSSDPDGFLAGWFWEFGDGTTSTQQQPTHTYGAAGTYTVTLTVTDDDGASDDFSRSVTVGTGEQPGFQIDLYFDAAVPPAMRTALRAAADHWERILLTDLRAYSGLPARSFGDRCDRPAMEFIDDIAIVVQMRNFSGGTLASAGPCIVRTSGEEAGLPVYGSIQIDVDSDVWTFDKAVEILEHETAHILGIGILWDDFIQAPCGQGGETPYFAEPNAVREFSNAAGRSADRVYVQMGASSTSGACRPGGHWGELMESELMSPSTSLSGPVQPLSAVTIGALEDLGWMVDYSQADPFVPRDALNAGPAAVPPGESYTDIVVPGPLLPDPGPARRR